MQEYASKVQLHKNCGASASPSASANVSASDSSDSSAGGDSGHPLLDFVVAADVFMYLGDLTVPPNLSPIYPLSIPYPLPPHPISTPLISTLAH